METTSPLLPDSQPLLPGCRGQVKAMDRVGPQCFPRQRTAAICGCLLRPALPPALLPSGELLCL